MPEGDTIYRTATALRAALLGKQLVSFAAPRHSGLLPGPNAVVERVDSHGKHLEIGFDDGVILHTHMRMTGTWHLYRTGEAWRKSASQARVALTVPGWQAVCFNAPVVEIYRSREATRHPGLGSLGPDLCRADADIVDCVARIERYCPADLSVAEMLLDQRVACGVGNVFKSEVLWVCQLHPLSPVEALTIDQRFRLLETVSSMLRANLERAERVTVPEVPGGTAVYARTGKPCFRCGLPIEVRKHGQQARVTYFCAGCQVHLGQPVARTQQVDGDDVSTTSSSRRSIDDDDDDGDNDDLGEDTIVLGAWRDLDDGVDDGVDIEPLPDIEDRHPAAVAHAHRGTPRPSRHIDPLLARRAAPR